MPWAHYQRRQKNRRSNKNVYVSLHATFQLLCAERTYGQGWSIWLETQPGFHLRYHFRLKMSLLLSTDVKSFPK